MIERDTSLPWALHTNFNVEDGTNHDRTEKPVVCRDSWCKSRAINGKRGWHRLQNSWIATFCCETSWQRSCSWTCQEDRESPHRLSRQNDLQQNSLRPVQYESQENDSGLGQCGAVWIVRDWSQDAVQRMLFILEWRHRLMHMRVSWKKVQRTEASSNKHRTISLSSRLRD